MYRVIWSDFAVGQLEQIFQFFTEKADDHIARSIVLELLSTSEKLIEHPELGPREITVIHLGTTYRYLVQGNYKIIYSVDEQSKVIRISDVFDVRQSPEKLFREKD